LRHGCCYSVHASVYARVLWINNTDAVATLELQFAPPDSFHNQTVAAEIAFAVRIEAVKAGVAPKISEDGLRERVRKTQWTPAYSAME